ncbi:nitroreductase family protein [Methylomonas rosea]|uniref:Nitroreductase family protein n=1 Tax=Methylomonas rosea TaxID=2952227 RepID=A0ABT1TYC3_9GAMM|nr:nitroreductase family protein [Methylomonas sp. WSC-7]MCQ8119771.1 nitroreductase family protein [Methylomonas sp. WSC-7]
MQHKRANTQVDIHDLIASRWSPRAFDPDKAVSHQDLTAVLEAARWAPSCFNDQPWRFVVCDKSRDASAWQNALSVIAEKNQLWAKNAPVLILTVAMANFNHNGKANRFAAYDTGAASVSLCLQANALGLVTHQMGGFDADKARQVLNLPDDCTPMAMLALGYQAEANTLAEDFQAGEQAERSRAALEQRFYLGQWGEAFK